MCWKCNKPSCRHRWHRLSSSTFPAVTTVLVMAALALAGLLASPATLADEPAGGASTSGGSSDLLIILDDDGKGYTAQHTLFSDGALLTLALPEGVTADDVRFGGPERRTFDTAWQQSPTRLALWSGSALIRYRHRFGVSLIEEQPGEYSLLARSVPERLRVEDGQLTESTITWLFPAGTRLEGFTAANGAADGWRSDGHLLSFTQQGGRPHVLGISWRRGGQRSPSCDDVDDQAAGTGILDSDQAGHAGEQPCAPDIDGDGIADHRDVCLATLDEEFHRAVDPVDTFGCALVDGKARDPLELDDIRFASGQSYLELAARRQLDRLAQALPADENSIYEIGAHTDRAGKYARNLKLSEQRANAIRHYLMLRGVSPNRLRAAGYGETRPLDRTDTAAAARTNRRIELRRLD